MAIADAKRAGDRTRTAVHGNGNGVGGYGGGVVGGYRLVDDGTGALRPVAVSTYSATGVPLPRWAGEVKPVGSATVAL
jgi:hypothetical protein